ncbi:MAG: ATPase [Phycisphaerae bacterium]|nr:ATPase [Phycisphaerae bacterium]
MIDLATRLRGLVGKILGRSEGLLAATFLALILIGSILLVLPTAHAEGKVGPLDALFTATSAVCVTGLVVVDTGADFTPFGQVVIIILIQLGGLGIMTFAALATQLVGRRLSFRQQALLSDAFYQQSAANLVRENLKRIVLLTCVCELLGTVLLYIGTWRFPGPHRPLSSAAFHSISAFCNAGFSLNADSLTGCRARPLVMLTIMALIVIGGLGHTVVLESLRRIWQRVRRRRVGPVPWSLNSRVVLWASGSLIVVGTIALLLFGMTENEETWAEALSGAVFQSVTARTAGFNSVDIGALPMASLLALIGLMFIGGSPGSCAGGIKTTSLVTALARLRARLKGRPDVSLWGRRLSEDVIARASVVIGLAIVWNAMGCVILAATELPSDAMAFEDLVFEQVSAFATVGLSTGITAGLSAAGKLWIIASMFVGRLGPLTAALAVMPQEIAKIRYPEEHMMIG